MKNQSTITPTTKSSIEWTQTNEYLMGQTNNFKFGTKLAMFDLDSTLIIPKIGNNKGFPINSDDWKFLFPNVKQTLKTYENDGYSIIIISNQGGISLGKQTVESWSNKINQIQNELQIDLYVFCSINHNKYRKPYPTWFNEFIPSNIHQTINRKVSFYCGDACGRPGDFSNTDYKFALNCMVKFVTPELFFIGKFENIPKIVYPDIFNIQNNSTDSAITVLNNFVPNKKEMILMIGYQGSGKSYVANVLKEKYNYTVINQDTLKSKSKCLKNIKISMSNSESIVIDQTNPDKDKRNEFITIAKINGYTVRAILMTTSLELSQHNNYFRHITTGTKIVPKIAYNIYGSKFEEPELNEGYSNIIKIHPSKPKDYNYYFYLY